MAGRPKLLAHVGRLTRERDEARADVERLRALLNRACSATKTRGLACGCGASLICTAGHRPESVLGPAELATARAEVKRLTQELAAAHAFHAVASKERDLERLQLEQQIKLERIDAYERMVAMRAAIVEQKDACEEWLRARSAALGGES
jgi:hypothetical protein